MQNDQGYISINRRVWNHEIFAGEPFSRREAWLWMISEAAFASCKKIDCVLERGELGHSIRFMAQAWRWHPSRVERFLKTLKKARMIACETRSETRNETRPQVIRICNYNRFQRRQPEAETRTEPRSETNYKNLNNRSSSSSREPSNIVPISQEAGELVGKLAAICGFPDPQAWPIGWYGGALRAQRWLDNGWRPDVMLPTAERIIAGKRDGAPANVNYFEKAFARAHAPGAELPTTSAHERNGNNGRRNFDPDVRPSGRRGLRNTLDRMREWSDAILEGDGGTGNGGNVAALPHHRGGRP